MHRLPRESPWAATSGCALAIGLLLTSLGGGILYMALTHRDEQGQGIVYIVGGGFALVGLLLLYSGIHQLIARAGVKETIFEVEELPLRRGKAVQATVIQEGPVKLLSLRANLVCFEIETRKVQRKSGPSTEKFTQQIADGNLLDEGPIELGPGETLERSFLMTVAPDARPTGTKGNRTIEWKVEVWGRVKSRPDFMHPFVVRVE